MNKRGKVYSKKLRIDLIDLEKIKNICYPMSNKRFSLFKIFTTNKKVELEKNTMIAEANDEGFKNGILVGEKRGEKRGEALGEKRGINKRNMEIAKSMIQKKFNLDSISEITGLSIKELSKLSIG